MKMHVLTFLSALMLLFSAPVLAQTAAPVSATAAASAVLVGPPAPALPAGDALGRATPKGMIDGFLKAVGDENYQQAGEYLDLKGIPAARQKTEGAVLARTLQTLLDQNGRVEAASKLSDKAEGAQDDGLPPELDIVGTIKSGKKTVDVLAERRDQGGGLRVWQISRKTVAVLPELLEDMTPGLLDKVLPSQMVENKWYGVPVGHWLALLAIAGLSLLPTWFMTRGVTRLVRRFWPATRAGYPRSLLDALELPIRLYIALGVFAAVARAAGISIVARQYFMLVAEIAAWLSLWWVLWCVIDISTQIVQSRMLREKRAHALSTVIFLRRVLRLILAALAAAIAMSRIGLDVTGWFAALGIGGLALAFGAKTTLENFVVGLTLVINQPLRVGDFCKIGDIKGTVDDIGMRSTRLVTPDKTVMTLPNTFLVSQPIENFTLRSSFWFHPVLALRYGTKPEDIRQLIGRLGNFLGEHPAVEKDTVQVSFSEMGSSSLNVEIVSYISAPDFGEFKKIRTDLHLRIMDIVAELGIALAFPSQTVYLARDR